MSDDLKNLNDAADEEELGYDDPAEEGADDYDEDAPDEYEDDSAGEGADEGEEDSAGEDEDYADDGEDYGDEDHGDEGGGEPAKMKREWINSITTSKKVKREEMRRKLKRAMLFMLVFALVVTSIVYVMLLFIQENNVRITANSQNSEKSISLSFDNNYWTPYLNAQGPTKIWDVSYSKEYDREELHTTDEVLAILRADNVRVGTMNGENFIRFVFMLRNNGASSATVDYEMTLANDTDSGLQNAVRVMWGQSFKNLDDFFVDEDGDGVADNDRTETAIYAAKSFNPRLANTNINWGVDPDQGYIEYVAYPVGSDDPNYELQQFHDKIGTDEGMSREEADRYGYTVATTPFENSQKVFSRTATLTQGDIMYCYVCIWLEGSDFDCVNDALGGYVTIGINFVAH